MTTREIVEGGSRWRWPDQFVWTDPRTGEQLILDPADVTLIWSDPEGRQVQP